MGDGDGVGVGEGLAGCMFKNAAGYVMKFVCAQLKILRMEKVYILTRANCLSKK